MPAPVLFVVSGVTQYLGAALAVWLFAVAPAPSVGWLRLLAASVVLLAWRRPWRRHWTRQDFLLALAFGVTLALMNVFFYAAIDLLPLGTAVAIEFLGPVTVAAVAGGRRERAAIGLAGAGVLLLAGVTVELGGPQARLGLLAIAAAAACWAGYIVLGSRVAGSGDGVTRLAVAMTAGTLVLAPLLAPAGVPVLQSWRTAAAVVGVGVLSSVVPYAIEQVVLRRVAPATFAVLLATLPATAALVGAVVLAQLPHPVEVVGLVAVSAAIALASASGRRPAAEPPPA